MSSAIVRWNFRYAKVKFWDAYSACTVQIDTLQKQRKAGKEVSDEVVREMYESISDVFMKAFSGRITEVIKLTGPAMAPTLNRKGTSDPAITEMLVIRKLRSPSIDNVRIGDVVSFLNPRNQTPHNLMVRRVAAVPGDVLENDKKEETVILPGHCWVLADNSELEPPNVEDSRSFGPLPMEFLEGRVIYAIRNASDHGSVDNDDTWKDDDASVIAAETPEELTEAAGTSSGTQDSETKKSDSGKWF